MTHETPKKIDKLPSRLISRQDAARLANAHIRTVDYWRHTNRIKTYKNDLGHVRVDADEVEKIMAMKAADA